LIDFAVYVVAQRKYKGVIHYMMT